MIKYMKIYSTTTSERGKPVQKGANTFLKTVLSIDKNEVMTVFVDNHNFIYIKDKKHITIACYMMTPDGNIHKV